MASNISKYLGLILNAVYGKDVRQAIHDGISQCYADVNNPTLINGALVNAVQDKIDDGTIPSIMIADRSVTEEKLSDDVINLINSGTYVYGADGTMYSLIVNDDGTLGIKKANAFFPSKKILSNIDFSEAYKPDGLSVYCVTDKATKEILYAVPANNNDNISPFKNFNPSGGLSFTASKALKKILDCSGAFSVVFDDTSKANNISSWMEYACGAGMRVYIKNEFSGSWNNLTVHCVSVPYVNTSGEHKTISYDDVKTTQSGVGLSDIDVNWERCIVAYSFEADGHIKVIYNGTLVWTFEAPADFASWDYSTIMTSNWNDTTISVSSHKNTHFTMMNNPINETDVMNYHEYLNGNSEATGISSLDGIYAQVGDKCNLFYQILPTTYVATASVNTSNSAVITYDSKTGVLECVSEGSATINISCDNITVQIPVVVGQEVSDGAKTSIEALATKTVDTVVVVNEEDIPAPMNVGDEFAVYALALNSVSAVPYSVYEQNMVDFKSSNPAVCSVEYGVLHANSVGSAIITVSAVNDSNVKKTFTVSVAEKSDIIPECDVYYCNDRQFGIYNDGTHEASTTEGIQNAMNYASEQGFRCIRFNDGVYLIDPAKCPINIPSGLIVDFNGAVIRPTKDNANVTAKKPYCVFSMIDSVGGGFINANVFGDNVYGGTYHVEASRSMQIIGGQDIIVKNCEFSYATGFNFTFSYDFHNSSGGDTRCSLTLTNVEVGDMNDDGTVGGTSVSGHFRSKDFIDISRLTDNFALGNMVGYQGYMYMESRLYHVYFYDADKKFISMKKWCVQYQTYAKPENAKFAKVMFFQESAPTNKDADFNSIAMFYSARSPKHMVIKDCIFKEAYSTGISPQGGKNVIIDHCEFFNCGKKDPASCIDWEDGRIHIQGHIVKNCTFHNGNGQFNMINGRDITVHDNVFDGVAFYNKNETQNSRIFRNIFTGRTANNFSLASKTDMIFTQNVYDVAPKTTAPVGGRLLIVDNKLL